MSSRLWKCLPGQGRPPVALEARLLQGAPAAQLAEVRAPSPHQPCLPVCESAAVSNAAQAQSMAHLLEPEPEPEPEQRDGARYLPMRRGRRTVWVPSTHPSAKPMPVALGAPAAQPALSAEAQAVLDKQLCDAATSGDAAAIGRLVAKGASPNAKDKDGEPAVVAAAVPGHTEVVEALLRLGCDPNAPDEYGTTALMWAAMNRHLEVVRALVDAGADPNATSGLMRSTPLMVAASEGDTDMMYAILGQGQGRASELDVNAVDREGKTALIHAAARGHVECARLLLEAGADASLRVADTGDDWGVSFDGMTALDVARAAQISLSEAALYGHPPRKGGVEGARKVEALLKKHASSTREERGSDHAAVQAMEPGTSAIEFWRRSPQKRK